MPKAVLLDLFGTLFQLEPLGDKLAAAGVPASSLKLWFARTLRDAWALEVAGQYRAFREVALAALEVLVVELGGAPDKARMEAVVEAFPALPAYPDVKDALERLRAADVRLVAVGNGSAEVSRALFERNGLSQLLERRISIDEVRHWKPHASVYRYALDKLGLAGDEVTLIAAHAWDVHGAKRAGLRGAWVSRLEKRFEPAMGAPDVQGETVADVVEALLAR